MSNDDLTLRDHLAIDRTRLANQRTLLAMLRTGLYLILMSLTIWSLNIFEDLRWLTGGVMLAGVMTGIIGILLYKSQKKKINNSYLGGGKPRA